MSLRVPALLSILLLALLVPGVAQAAWPHDPSNGNVPLCTAAGLQSDVTMIPDGAGGAIVTWYDNRSGNLDIYAQRVNAAGLPQWTANGVALCSATNDQWYPTIVSDGVGGAIVTWYDFRGGVNNDIYAQRVSASGAPQWTTDGVALCTATGDQFFPTIASDGAGGAIATWYDTRNGNNDIFAQRVNASGATQWGVNGKIVSNLPASQVVPTIISDGAGGAIITWFDLRSGNWDVYAQRINGSGTGLWTVSGVALSAAAGDQRDPKIISDGAGGAIVTWSDGRSGNSDIYAQRVDASGNVQWTFNGVALCTAANEQTIPSLVSDGSGGAVVAWPDARGGTNDIYAQRVGANGAAQWTLNGVALCTAAGTQNNPAIASDGAGGAIVTWHDLRSGVANDIYANRVTSTGAALWSANGSALCTAVGDQQLPALIADAAGGAIVAWHDGRSGNYDIYVQQVERFGYLGDPGSVIASVKDVPNDQGGKIKVSWSASYLDIDPLYGILEYRLWRSVPTQALLSSSLSRMTTHDPDEAAATGMRLVMPFAATDYAWELVGTQTAAILQSYSLVASTTSDSAFGSNPRTAFMLEARAGSSLSSPRWFSAPDSGYSVDNIAPAPPAPFTAKYSGGNTALHWGVSTELDFAAYRLYRGSSAGFVPGPSNLVTSSPDTGYVDPNGAPAYYKLSAVDVHGNESGFALVTPSGTVDIPGPDSPLALRLGIPQPNPARGATRIAFDLPRATTVSLAVYDPSGRRVRELSRGRHEEGRFSLSWDLRDDSGHSIASGMYFVRLEAMGRALTQRMVAMP